MYSAMKKTLTISVLAALVLCGCQKEELKIEKTTEQKTFTAEIESDIDDAATKTSLGDQGKVLWKVGDEVSIFAGNTDNAEYKVTEVTDENTRAVMSPASSSETGTGANVAYYPYSSALALASADDAYTISNIKLPATQTYAQASFADGAFPMAAVSDNATLKFKNILGGLKLQLTGTAKVRSISVSGNNNEILCGSATVTVSSTADPSITLSESTATTVTLDCGTEGVQLNEDTATPFIIALPPMTFSKGFTVTVTDTEDKEMVISTANSKTIQRSQLLKMKPKEYKGDNPFTLTSVYSSTSVSIVKSGSPADISLQYRKNSEAWADYTVGTEITLANGETLKFRAGANGNSTFSTSDGYYQVSTTGSGDIIASGNIMSLLDRTLAKSDVPTWAFWDLFYGNTKLTDAANLKLPATTLSDSCYYGMFWGCGNLTKAPELPATTLSPKCYYHMFYQCTFLKYVKALFTAIPESGDCLGGWLKDVSTSRGTFVRNSAVDEATAKTWMSNWGISNWTTTTAE